MCTVPWKRVSQQRFGEMFNVVVPAAERSNGFLLGETHSHKSCSVSKRERQAYTAFMRIGEQHYEALQPITIPEFAGLIGADVTRNQVQRG